MVVEPVARREVATAISGPDSYAHGSVLVLTGLTSGTTTGHLKGRATFIGLAALGMGIGFSDRVLT